MDGVTVLAVVGVTLFVALLAVAVGSVLTMHWLYGDAVVSALQKKVREKEAEIDDLVDELDWASDQWADAEHRLQMAGLSSGKFDDKDCEVCYGDPNKCYESQCPLQLQPAAPTCTVEECVICNQKPMMEPRKDLDKTQTYLNTNPTAVES